jgi:diguanylate cyclase (GGDEF)-like protein/PAS domain S-box-containing protein
MRLSLRYKAALLIALTEFALLSLLVVTNLYNTRQNLEEELSARTDSTTELIAASATEPLLAYDLAQLQNLLNGVMSKYGVVYGKITDHRDSVLAEVGVMPDATTVLVKEYPIKIVDSVFGKVYLAVSRADTELALAATTQSNLVIVAIEIILVAMISLTLGWFLTRNIEILSLAADDLSLGNYSTRVRVKANDEVGALATRFNEMATKLETTVVDLNHSHKRFRDMADNISDWLWETDSAGRYTYVSNKVESLLGYGPERLIGTSAFDLMTAPDAKRLRDLFGMAKKEHKPFYGLEFSTTDKDGGVVILEANGNPIIDESGILLGYRGVTRDITRRKNDESRLIYLAEHDALTGLLSRHRFLEILEDEIKLSFYSNTPLTVVFLDLDGFKLINDTHGHMVGDSLLRVIADLLLLHAGEGNYISRLGGDEFGVLLRHSDPEQGIALAQRILAAIEATELAIGGKPVHLSACIGLCSYPQDGADNEMLLAHADVALSRAKAQGHNRYHVFQPTDTSIEAMRQTVNWQTLIHEAIETNRLYLDYQPIMGVNDRRGEHYFEALVRLRDRDDSRFTAARFIDTAEYTGQVAKIDMWVLREILRVLNQPAQQDCVIAMNLSGRSLGTPGFLEYFQEQILASKVDPVRLVFEVTESAAIAEMTKAKSFILVMKDLGYRFSLDDFGVGFSSFSYLKHLPVDQIKIDGGFVQHLDTSREDQIFVSAIVQVARELGLVTVAEFVESQEILELLIDIGVDYVQGFHVGRPGAKLVAPTIEYQRDSEYKIRSKRI